MATTDNLLVLDFCHLVNNLTNINDMLKIDFCHLAHILINTNDKVDNFIKKRLVVFNQLFTFYH